MLAAVIEDMAGFLVEFNDVIGGFGARAEAVTSLLREPRVAFILVGTPEPLAICAATTLLRIPPEPKVEVREPISYESSSAVSATSSISSASGSWRGSALCRPS